MIFVQKPDGRQYNAEVQKGKLYLVRKRDSGSDILNGIATCGASWVHDPLIQVLGEPELVLNPADQVTRKITVKWG